MCGGGGGVWDIREFWDMGYLETVTWAFWLSPAVSTRDSIIKPESFSVGEACWDAATLLLRYARYGYDTATLMPFLLRFYYASTAFRVHGVLSTLKI